MTGKVVHCGVLVALPVALLAGAWAYASSPAGIGLIAVQSATASSAIDPRAEALLKRTADTLAAAQTLSAEVTEDDVHPARGTRKTDYLQRWVSVETLAKPFFFRSESQVGVPSKTDPSRYDLASNARSVADGKLEWDYFPRNNQYRSQPSNNAQSREISPLTRLNGFLKPLSGFYTSRASVWSDVQILKKEGRLLSLRLTGQEEWEGASYQVVELTYADDFEYTEEQLQQMGASPVYTYQFFIGSDHLVHRLKQSHPWRGRRDYQVRNLTLGSKPADPAAFAFKIPEGAQPMPEPPKLLTAGTPAPDFTLLDKAGNPVKLSDFKGKVVVLDFWATWCQPCQKAMPHLKAVQEATRKQDVVFLGACVWDDRKAFDTWIGKKEALYPFTFGFDPAARDSKNSIAVKLYQVHAIPVTYVIDRDGRIAASLLDYEENDHRLEAALTRVGVTVKLPQQSDVAATR